MNMLAEIKDWHELINEVVCGNCLDGLRLVPDNSVDCCITSPPYWGLRDYGNDEQLGLEKTPEEYVTNMVSVFRGVKRALKKEGTLWLILGDSYAGGGRGCNTLKQKSNKGTQNMPTSIVPTGLKPKDLVGIPWRVAFALQEDGWYLRQDIIWHKPNPMPESVTDRCTKSHEYVFLLAKSPKYYFNNKAIQEKSVYSGPMMVDGFVPKSVNGKHGGDPQNSANRKKYRPSEAGGGTSMINHNGYFKENGDTIGKAGFRNKRDVWSVTTSPFKGSHFATFPTALIEPMIKAGCPEGGLVLDPFMGAFTLARVAKDMGRRFIGFELNSAYCEIGEDRLKQQNLF